MSYAPKTLEDVEWAYRRPIPPDFYSGRPYTIIAVEPLVKDGEWFVLPKFRMMALFDSIPLAAHLPAPNAGLEGGDASFLTILWFQDEYFPLLSDENRRRIAALNWAGLAQNDYW
jgi:hypothetical protein